MAENPVTLTSIKKLLLYVVMLFSMLSLGSYSIIHQHALRPPFKTEIFASDSAKIKRVARFETITTNTFPLYNNYRSECSRCNDRSRVKYASALRRFLNIKSLLSNQHNPVTQTAVEDLSVPVV